MTSTEPNATGSKAMNSELFHTIEQIGREKGLDTETMIQAL